MGEIAALGTSVLWSFTSVLFTLAGRRVGSANVNRTRLVVAVFFISLTHWALHGEIIPMDTTPERAFWLGLSGVIGLVAGDASLFQAFVLIGPRLSMLMMALAPVMSTLLAWIFLGEHLGSVDLLAILITVAGIAWVVWESNVRLPEVERKDFILGIFLGIGGALGQAVGLITSKLGMEGGFPPLSATLLRMVTAMFFIWLLTIFQGKARSTLQALKDRKAALSIVGASIVGPFLGVWLSLIAIDQAQVGIASTLMSLSPIFLIPLAKWVFKEQVSSRVVFGTVIALIGVTMIFTHV
jgi:drug/metabolite transporter (DMT)-like permease